MSLNAGERICLFAPRNVITAGAERQNVPTAGENCVCGELQYPQERRKEQAEIEKKRTEALPDAWRNRQSTVPWKMRNRP